MLFSETFDVAKTVADDWFDPILNVDTKLFVDPFMVFLDDEPTWAGAHASLISHFDRAFRLLAEADCRPERAKYDGALALLTFPEPREFCLGYTAKGTRGSGSARGYARLIAEAMCSAIGRGVVHLDHFEEVGIFNEGIGPDRISDITCTVLKPLFVQYTQEVARRHGIPLVAQKLPAARFDVRRTAPPISDTVELPQDPSSDRPILLVPERFLRDLPVLNAEDWFRSTEAADVRRELSVEVLANVPKKDIVAIARRHVESVREWSKRKEQTSPPPYDLAADPKGVYRWHGEAGRFAREHPLDLSPPPSDAAFFDAIDLMVAQYRHFVEERRGWSLLWNDDGSEKPEEAAQLLFQGVVAEYCKANGIVVDREVELGRGPVDFKFSNGYSRRALLEVKKLHNGKFWNGLDAQLPSYLRSDDCKDGWFVAIQYRTGGTSKQRRKDLPREVERSAVRHGVNLRSVLVDARRKPSASKLKRKREE